MYNSSSYSILHIPNGLHCFVGWTKPRLQRTLTALVKPGLPGPGLGVTHDRRLSKQGLVKRELLNPPCELKTKTRVHPVSQQLTQAQVT